MLRNNLSTLSAELQEQINQAENKSLHKIIARLQQAGIQDEDSVKLLLTLAGSEALLKRYTKWLITLFNLLGNDTKRYSTYRELISQIASNEGLNCSAAQGAAAIFNVISQHHSVITDAFVLNLKELISRNNFGLGQLANVLNKLDLSLFNDKELFIILDKLETGKSARRSDVAISLHCIKKNGLYDKYSDFILQTMQGTTYPLRVALEKLDANHQLNKETLSLLIKAKLIEYSYIVKCLESLRQDYPPYLALIFSYMNKEFLSQIIRPLQSAHILNKENLKLFQTKLDNNFRNASAVSALADYHLLNQENLNRIFNHENPDAPLGLLYCLTRRLTRQHPLTKNMFEQCLSCKQPYIDSRLFDCLQVRSEAQFNQAYEAIDILRGGEVLHVLEQLPRYICEQHDLLGQVLALCQQHRHETAAQIQARCVNYLRGVMVQNLQDVGHAFGSGDATSINDSQSTHNPPLQRSINESAKRLAEQYPQICNNPQEINKILLKIRSWINDLPRDNADLVEAAQKYGITEALANPQNDAFSSSSHVVTPAEFLKHKALLALEIIFSSPWYLSVAGYAHLHITTQKTIALLWTAIHDDEARLKGCTAYDGKIRLVKNLYEGERGYNLKNVEGIDHGGRDGKICVRGMFNKLFQDMSSIHSAIELTYVNDQLVSMLVKATINRVAGHALSHLHQFALSDDELETLKQELNASEYERFWGLIKEKVSQPIQDEFGSYYSAPADKKRLEDIIEQTGLYTEYKTIQSQLPSLTKEEKTEDDMDEFAYANPSMTMEETQYAVPDEQESILHELEELMYSHAVTKAKYLSSAVYSVFTRITSSLDDPDLQDLMQLQRLLDIPRLGEIIKKMQFMPAFARLNTESPFLTSSSSSCYMEDSYSGKLFDSHKKTKKRTQDKDFEENEKVKLKK
jgi:hypothetical protein